MQGPVGVMAFSSSVDMGGLASNAAMYSGMSLCNRWKGRLMLQAVHLAEGT